MSRAWGKKEGTKKEGKKKGRGVLWSERERLELHGLTYKIELRPRRLCGVIDALVNRRGTSRCTKQQSCQCSQRDLHDIYGMKVAFWRNEQTRSNLLTQLEPTQQRAASQRRQILKEGITRPRSSNKTEGSLPHYNSSVATKGCPGPACPPHSATRRLNAR